MAVEFGLLTLYGLWAARTLRNCRVLLLMEAEPNMLAGRAPAWRTWLRRRICHASDLALTNNLAGRRYLVVGRPRHTPRNEVKVGVLARFTIA